MSHRRPETILSAYDLTPPIEFFALPNLGVNNLATGVRAGDGSFIWKSYQTYSDLAAIRYEHQLLRWLAIQGLSFAVPAPIFTRDGETLCQSPAGWRALFPQIPGRRPDHNNLSQMEAVGAALGELHVALSRYPTTARPGVQGYSELDKVHPLIPDPYSLTPGYLRLEESPALTALFHWWRAELNALRGFLQSAFRELPRQVIHGDYGPGNTLCVAERVTGVLDFEFALPDARALDVAAGLKFAMRVWENPPPWPAAAAFCRGYARWVQLTGAEIGAIPWLIRLRDAVAAIWWLGRGLAAGDVQRHLWRMEEMQRFQLADVWNRLNELSGVQL